MKRKPTIALALGGGGARGIAHLGVIQAFAMMKNVLLKKVISAKVADCLNEEPEGRQRLFRLYREQEVHLDKEGQEYRELFHDPRLKTGNAASRNNVQLSA